jgi:uncharacterized cupin superfamily protein
LMPFVMPEPNHPVDHCDESSAGPLNSEPNARFQFPEILPTGCGEFETTVVVVARTVVVVVGAGSVVVVPAGNVVVVPAGNVVVVPAGSVVVVVGGSVVVVVGGSVVVVPAGRVVVVPAGSVVVVVGDRWWRNGESFDVRTVLVKLNVPEASLAGVYWLVDAPAAKPAIEIMMAEVAVRVTTFETRREVTRVDVLFALAMSICSISRASIKTPPTDHQQLLNFPEPLAAQLRR